jgi:hypothetical protein
VRDTFYYSTQQHALPLNTQKELSSGLKAHVRRVREKDVASDEEEEEEGKA